tara:strand:- start:237 stop:599 length:363 start_codon:yes stop_codon:yes gene_type:complete
MRISKEALNKILSGQVKKDVTCIVKFYTNSCPFCENLHDYYIDIAENKNFTDLNFFAFNMADDPGIENRLSFNGVPTISVIKARKGDPSAIVSIMPDPDPPNEHTWYYSKDIQEFIERQT